MCYLCSSKNDTYLMDKGSNLVKWQKLRVDFSSCCIKLNTHSFAVYLLDLEELEAWLSYTVTWELCQLQILIPWFQLVPVSPELESLSLQGHKKRYYDQEEDYPLQEMFKNTWTPYLVFLSYYRNIIFLAKGGFVTTEYMFNYHSFLLIAT